MSSSTVSERAGVASRGKADPRPVRPDALVFRASGQRYAIPLGEILEIVPMAHLAKSPSLPTVVEGFLNLGGQAVTVVRLSRLFGLPDQPTGLHTPLLVLRNAEPPLALLVEQVDCISRLVDPVLPIRADDSFNGAVAGVTTLNGQTTLLLAPDLLLLVKEQQCLAEFQDREQSRLRALAGVVP